MSERQLGHYTILESIGSGGMGEVFAAEDTRLSRKVALKILPEEMAAKPDRRARFERETKAVAALNHPNIVTIYSVEEIGGVHYFTMELIEGQSLGEAIPTDGMPVKQFFDHAIALTDAIASAHRQGITHRDLKPDNVRITTEGRLKVLDFGLAKLREPESGELAETIVEENLATQEGKIVGSVHYMSPEQAQGKEVDHRSDIFSIGILLYEMATGLRPFQGDTSLSVLTAILRDDPPSVTDLRRALPRHLGRIIQRCLGKDPDGRYQSARVLRDELIELRDEVVSGSRESWPGEPLVLGERPRRKSNVFSRGGFALASLILIAVAIFYIAQIRRGPESSMAAEMSVAVVDFRNLSAPEDLTPSTILTSLVQVGLIESSPCRVVSLEYLKDLRRRLFGSSEGPIAQNQALQLAREGGATNLLFGDITEMDDQIGFNWQLVDAASGEALGGGRINGEDYASIADATVGRVLPLLTAACGTDAADDLSQIPVGDLTTQSTEAYRRFLAAQRAMDELRYYDAAQDLQQAVALDSSFALGLSHLAKVLGDIKHESAESKQVLEKAWELRGKLGVKDRLKLESTRAALNDNYKEYVSIHEEILERWPDDRDALQAMINFRKNKGEEEEALELSGRAKRLYPEDRSINTTHAYILAGLGRLDEALASIQSHVTAFPDNPNGWDTLGDMYLKRSMPDSAAAAYRRAIEIAPNFWNSHVNLAICDFLTGDLAAAIGRMARLRSREDIPGNLDPLLLWWSHGFLRAAGRYGEALDLQRARIASLTDPKSVRDETMQLALQTLLAGRVEEAKEIAGSVEAPAEGEESMGSHFYNRSLFDIWLKIEEDSLDSARALLADFASKVESKMSSMNPERSALVLTGAMIEMEAGNPAAAATRIRDWRREHPADYTSINLIDPLLNDVYGEALLESGKGAKALEVLQDAQAAAGGWAHFHFTLGKVYEKLGRHQEAMNAYVNFLEYWSQADEDQPELEEAKTRLEALYELQS